MRFPLIFCAVISTVVCLGQAPAPEDALLTIIEEELKREVTEFSKAGQPPYFLAYRVSDLHTARLSSSFGSLVSSAADHSRPFVIDCRVGDHAFDNFHPQNGPGTMRDGGSNQTVFSSELPLDNHREAVQVALWRGTQEVYRSGLQKYKALKNMPASPTEVKVNDFSKEQKVELIEPMAGDPHSRWNIKEWESRIRKYSEPFLLNNHIIRGSAFLSLEMERKYYISSEGTRVAQNRTSAYLNISASILAEDGDILPLYLSYFAYYPAELPADDIILKDVQALIQKLELLRNAPVAEPYTGPAILHARAAGVFFHEIFGHRIEGHRLKDKDDAQTFKTQVGEMVLPKTMNVLSDPTLQTFNGQSLNGYYQVDDEGVKSRKVTVVEKGILKNFLMSRTPIENFESSNGHGRAQYGRKAVSRQANLIVQTEKPVQFNDLRKMLISECKKQKKPYGYLFADVTGGFTFTGRVIPNAFNIFPTEVYRVYTNGRPDELVRGVDLIGTPLAMFAEISAADSRPDVFTGFCGAESGSVPVTAISPSLFVKRIETQKKVMTQAEKVILKRPDNDEKAISNNDN